MTCRQTNALTYIEGQGTHPEEDLWIPSCQGFCSGFPSGWSIPLFVAGRIPTVLTWTASQIGIWDDGVSSDVGETIYLE